MIEFFEDRRLLLDGILAFPLPITRPLHLKRPPRPQKSSMLIVSADYFEKTIQEYHVGFFLLLSFLIGH